MKENGDRLLYSPRGGADTTGSTSSCFAEGPGLFFVFGALILTALPVLALLRSLDNQFLSDDWVFVYAAAQATSLDELFSRIPEHWFSRPALWVVAELLAGPTPSRVVFHGFLVGVHALNALVISALAASLLGRHGSCHSRSRSWWWAGGAVSGAVFLCYGLSHEVVFWFASVSEPIALSFRLLALLLLAGVYGRRSDWISMLALPVATAAALSAKESAIVAPLEQFLLIACLEFSSRQFRDGGTRRRVLVPVTGACLSLSTVLLWQRVFELGESSRAGLEVLKATPWEWLLRAVQAAARSVAFGGVVDSSERLGFVLAGIGAIVVAALWRRQILVVYGIAWLFVCLLPYVAISSVSDNEMGIPVLLRRTGVAEDRYYYGASAALAVVMPAAFAWLAVESSWITGRKRRLTVQVSGAVLALVWVGAQGAMLVLRSREWEGASRRMESVLRAVDTHSATIFPGAVVCVTDRPDNYRGRFILRNGVGEVFFMAAGHESFVVLTPPWIDGADCTTSISLVSE